jgi:hypothetical protein
MFTFIKALKKPPKIPMVYVCKHNGVAGVVRAEDFEQAVHLRRKNFIEPKTPTEIYRPWIDTTFLFSDKREPSPRRTFHVGTMDDFNKLIQGCYAEERVFHLRDLTCSRGHAVLRINELPWTLKGVHDYIHGL